MPLHLILGPPNSGRTDEVEQKYLRLLSRRPVLVVPGVDDIFDWERRLTRGRGALLGGQIVHFKDLYSEILILARSERAPVASELHRLHLVRQAIAAEWPQIAGRLPDQPGMAAALLELIDEFRSENMDPATVEARASEARHLGPLAAVYRSYLERLAEDGVTDLPAEAKAAIERSDRHWGNRPLMIAGFDELTRQQLELIRRLAFEAGVDVTVAVTHEPDNPALDLTATLIADLKSLAPEGAVTEEHKRRDGNSPHRDVLLKIQERFLRPGAPSDLAAEDGTVAVLRSAGPLNEAEAIGGRVADLVANGTSPAEIAIATAAPAESGVVIAETLARYDIPASVESETKVATTVTGSTVLQLLAAVRTDSVDQLASFLRNPAGPGAAAVDQLELRCRTGKITTAQNAVDRLEGGVPAWTALVRGDESPAAVVSRLAVEVADAILAGEGPGAPSPATVLETRATGKIAEACEEIDRLTDRDGQIEAIVEALSSGVVKVWSVPAQGTVRIASPYSLRAKRVAHLICAGLQEAPLTDLEKAGPFLSSRDRGALGMSDRRHPEVQQRYLFYSSLTVPTASLCLSCRVSDETGATEHPSPLIAAVEGLFERDADGNPRLTRGGRLGSDVVFPPAQAPTRNELARSLAATAEPSDVEVPGLDPDLRAKLDQAIAAAGAAEERSRSFGNLGEEVQRLIAADPTFAATDIEAYASCPYRWFIERQIRPQPFEPDPDYLAMGTLVHDSLEELYESRPGEIPRTDTLHEWLEQVPVQVEKHAADGRVRLDSDSVGHAALRRRAVLLIETHLRRESRWENPSYLPAMVEVGIGTRDSEIGPVPMRALPDPAGTDETGGETGEQWFLKGKIDRIDLSPDTGLDIPRDAVVIDYKTGTVAGRSHHKAAKDRRVQVQLYLHALREALGLNPVAGIYVPVRLGDEKARGAFEDGDGLKAEMEMRGVSGRDKVDDLSQFITAGLDNAHAAVDAIRAGVLDHDPALCPDHFEHPAVRHTGQTPEEEEFLNRSFV